MIFPFDAPRVASFWMKNTLIPLDMIFIRADGSIANIEANTVPLSLEPVYSDGPVAAVLEIAGGRSAELGIKAGDKVEWAALYRPPTIGSSACLGQRNGAKARPWECSPTLSPGGTEPPGARMIDVAPRMARKSAGTRTATSISAIARIQSTAG